MTTNISISEINSYLKCRRAWDLTSSNRQGLKHKATPKIYFTIGSAVHEAIDAQARGDDPYEFFEEYVSRERADRRASYEEAVGSTPWQSEMEEFEVSVNLARSLVEQYFSHYSGQNPIKDLGLKYVATEVPFSIPLSPDVNFVGTFDGIATDLATETKFYLIENKTTGRKPDMDMFRRGNQSKGYNWAFKALTGHKPVAMVYNVIMKRLIAEPKLLKSGALSQDKRASVTVQSFLNGLAQYDLDPLDYAEYIEMLATREEAGDDRFFLREKFHYTENELLHWYLNVLDPLVDEIASPSQISNYLEIYPNYTSCENCLVRDLCDAMDAGDDVAGVVSARYKVGKTPTERRVQDATPHMVNNAQDLVTYLETLNAVSG